MVVAFVVGAYAVPSGGFLVSGFVHVGSHFAMEIKRQHAKAAALGLVHGPDFPSLASLASSDVSVPDRGEEPFVHSHGGAEHAHAQRIARELRHVEDMTAGEEVSFVLASLTAHVPAGTPAMTNVPAGGRHPVHFGHTEPSRADPTLPPLHPPRS